MDSRRADGQLRLIAEVLELTRFVGVVVWLRGGWARDFYLGEFTRDHVDIDWLVWDTDAAALAETLAPHGYGPVEGPPPEPQRDYLKDGVDLSFALLARDEAGRPVVSGGPFAGTPWPEAAPSPEPGRLAGLESPIVGPRDQVTIKRMTPVWIPGRPRRAKDAEDIARLEAALAAREPTGDDPG